VDPWWQTGTRPRTENDPQTNGAGIDLSPAVGKMLGIDGKGKVDVEFLSTSVKPNTVAPAPAIPNEPATLPDETQVADFVIDLVNRKA
jgi:hypothetical protein